MLKRRVASGEKVDLRGPAVPCGIMGAYPEIFEMLSQQAYPDGGARQTATMTWFVDQGVAKVCLNDRDAGLSAWASGATFSDALDALEAGLRQDTLEWRAAGKRPGKKGGK